ncbi:MAG: alpha/beta hydrolase [Pseudomonadales bacterium]|nr:alpha/beta hydrolase [Pseudomonadales bacterium]
MSIFFDTLLRIITHLLLGYSAVVFILYLAQNRLIYLPLSPKPSSEQVTQLGLQFWPDDTDQYRGFIAKQTIKNSRGTIIVFHGNAGAAWQRAYYMQALTHLGYRVVLAEYPAYGGRSGNVGERHIVADANATLALAYEQFGEPLFLCGESLGAGVAASVLAQSHIPVQGIILLTPWDSLPALAQSIYWYFPARWLVRDQYNTIHNLQDYKGNIAVIAAGRDEIIPPSHTEHLFNSLPAGSRQWRLANARHNSWPDFTSESWWREVMNHVEKSK